MPKFNPFTSNLDYTKTTEESDYVNVTGDVMTGDLEFPDTGFIMNDGTTRWRVTINTDGALVTTAIASTAGSPYGLLLALTRPT